MSLFDSSESVGEKQIPWLNCAKFLAIIAVLIDHVKGVLYVNPCIQLASFYSVSLFVLISGITAYLSNGRHHESVKDSFWRCSRKILAQYLIATFIVHVTFSRGFNFENYVKNVVYFNALGPYYFVALYLQLMLISRILYNFLQSCKSTWKGVVSESCLCLAVCLFASWSTRYTNVLGIYGGGGIMLGGTYLILFYMGMVVAKHRWLARDFSKKTYFIVLMICGGLWFGIWRYMCQYGFKLDAWLPFGAGVNPPSLTLSLFAAVTLAMVWSATRLCENIYAVRFISGFGWLGKHTMSIFLYHLFLLHFMRQNFPETLVANNIWMTRIVCFSIMIFGSIVIETMTGICARAIRKIC